MLGPVADLVHRFRAQGSCIRLITGRPKPCPATFWCHTGALHKQRAEIAIATLTDSPRIVRSPVDICFGAKPSGKTASFGKGSTIGNTLTDCEQLFRAQEANKRMKDKAAHACQALRVHA